MIVMNIAATYTTLTATFWLTRLVMLVLPPHRPATARRCTGRDRRRPARFRSRGSHPGQSPRRPVFFRTASWAGAARSSAVDVFPRPARKPRQIPRLLISSSPYPPGIRRGCVFLRGRLFRVFRSCGEVEFLDGGRVVAGEVVLGAVAFLGWVRPGRPAGI